MKLLRPCFNQPSGTPYAEFGLNPMRCCSSCHCLDAQYGPDEMGEERAGEKIVRPDWQKVLFHTEVQDKTSDAWKSLEAYIAKIRDEGSDYRTFCVRIGFNFRRFLA